MTQHPKSGSSNYRDNGALPDKVEKRPGKPLDHFGSDQVGVHLESPSNSSSNFSIAFRVFGDGLRVESARRTISLTEPSNARWIKSFTRCVCVCCCEYLGR